MVFFRHVYMSAGVAEAPKERYGGVPLIPANITQQVGTSHTVAQSGLTARVTSNPLAVLGALGTAGCLGLMLKRSLSGDRGGLQRAMQYRVLGQSFTVAAMIVGLFFFGSKAGQRRTQEEEDMAEYQHRQQEKIQQQRQNQAH